MKLKTDKENQAWIKEFGYDFNELRKGFLCIDCNYDTYKDEYYMIKNHLWQEAGMTSEGGMLCIGCLEARLKKLLTNEDFTDVPVNNLDFGIKSKKLVSRLVKV